MKVKDLRSWSAEEDTPQRVPSWNDWLDSHATRSLSLLTSTWLWCLISAFRECNVLVTLTVATLNSHFSFRFTSTFAVPNLIWSSLESIKVLYVWRQRWLTSDAVSVWPQRRPVLRIIDLPAVYRRLSDHVVRTERGPNSWGKHQRSLFWFSGLLWPSKIPFRPALPRLQCL